MASRPRQRQPRNELTVEEKLEILKSLKDNNNKISRKYVQQRYNISKHTIDRILTREDDLKKTKNSKMRRIRSGCHRPVDEAVSKWYRSMQEQNIFVNGPLIRQQAVRFARMMNNHTFEANNGWLWRWQQKENVKFNSSHLGRKALAKAEAGAAAHSVKSAKDKIIRNELAENAYQQNFNDSSKHVFWQTMPAMPNQLERSSDVEHFEIDVKEEVDDDLHQNPFEADVVFDIESDEQQEQGGYDYEQSQYNYPPQSEHEPKCQNVNGEEMKNAQDETSMDPESLQYNSNFCQQPVEIKKEPNYYRTTTNDSEEESERYRSETKIKGTKNEKDPPPQDIYSVYGDYIARRLRASANERDNYEIYIAQHNIEDVIFKLSMGSYARDVQPSRFSSYENSRTENNVEEARQSRHKQPEELFTKERQQSFSSTAATAKTNDYQDFRSTSNVIDKNIPSIVHDFSFEKT